MTDDQPSDKAMQDAAEYNRIASDHGVADPGGFPGPEAGQTDASDPENRPDAVESSLESASDDEGEPLAPDDDADDAVEELGPPQ
ncbi:hypothetical protein [Microbacterium sp. Marseille-Q6965]|uniref:hypothetical protein n=1 Tax=Microbacterium sp. Marseille-Q6965 TaxID=2965072 RepID=UPI0021B74438|nr:hypothetical protein [Microbacterium sp. Marseille-Q6965]